MCPARVVTQTALTGTNNLVSLNDLFHSDVSSDLDALNLSLVAVVTDVEAETVPWLPFPFLVPISVPFYLFI